MYLKNIYKLYLFNVVNIAMFNGLSAWKASRHINSLTGIST